ncbi:putative RING-type E3 ubiquitin transferase C3H69 [Tanacetum coccineum]
MRLMDMLRFHLRMYVFQLRISFWGRVVALRLHRYTIITYGYLFSLYQQHAYRDGHLEETVLRHLGAEDGQTVIAKDIRLSDFLNRMQIRDLSVGIFQGPLPPSIAMLTHLMELNVSNNPFTNNIPMFPSAFVLTSMYPSLIFDL